MKLGLTYDYAVPNFVANSNTTQMDTLDQDTIETLKAKIAQLELELHNEKKAAERSARLLQVMRGDDFNDESLH